MAQNKVILTFFLVLLLSFTIFCGCAEKAADSDLLERGNDGVNSLNQTTENETPGDLPAVTPGESSSEDDTTIVETPPEELPPVTPEEPPEEKIYCNATLEDDFADDKVLVVLKKEKDLSRIWRLEDFPEVQASELYDVTSGTLELIQKQLEAERTGNWGKLQYYVDNAMLINIPTFRRILCFTLIEKNKATVLETVKLLEKRDEVRSAEPSYISRIIP